MRVLALLPVRNGEDHLPRYFASARLFADGILALDDGSTDRTRQLLESEPAVRHVMSNPRRESFLGWDDFENRQRLLDLAARFEPDWVVFLDADESFPADEARDLRRLLELDELAEVALAFRVFRMLGDDGSFDKDGLWVYRAFRYRPGLRLPERKLHFVPVPISIPQARWVKTALRIQHFAGTTEARRRARYEKYKEVDPNGTYQESYENILDPPGRIRKWVGRSPFEELLWSAQERQQ